MVPAAEISGRTHLRLGRLRRLPHRPLPRRGTPVQPHLGLEPRRRGAAARPDRRGQGDSGMATENPERREERKRGAHDNPAGPHLETRPRTPKNQLRRRKSKLARKNAISGGARRKPGDIHTRRKPFLKPVEPRCDENSQPPATGHRGDTLRQGCWRTTKNSLRCVCHVTRGCTPLRTDPVRYLEEVRSGGV